MPGFPGLQLDIDGKDWPNRSTSRIIKAAGLTWHVQETGPTDSDNGGDLPKKLLLLHGTGASTHSFRDVMPLLAKRFQLLVPDLPGHGFTDGTAETTSLPGMARAVQSLLKATGFQPDAIIGHSAGAAVAIRMGLSGTAVSVIIGINAALMPFRGLAQKLFPSIARLLVLNPLVPRIFAYTANAETVRRLIEGTGSKIDPDGLKLYQRLFANPAHCAGALSMMARWELEPLIDALPRLKIPLHLVVGTEDRAVPPDDADEIRKRHPSIGISKLPGLGHLAHEENPHLLAAELIGCLSKFT
jgi:magnesium chelatase accessory protein